MKKFLVFILFLAVIVVGLVFTCPTKQQHVDAVMNEVNGLMSDAASDVGLDTDSGWGMVGKMAIGSLAQNYLESQLYYNNYFVFSTCQITFNGKTSITSVGVFNHVFTTDKEKMKEKLFSLDFLKK
jgi:hypothetical protein